MDEAGKGNLTERAATAIRRLIRERGLKPGDVIATEGELAEMMSVSRNALREAVGRLRGLGLVDSRQSKGLVVAQSDPSEVMRLVLPHYVVDVAGLAELGELRYCLEMGAVDLAVDRATEEDISRLRELGEAFAEAIDRDQEEADRLDAAFHRALFEATHDPLVEGMAVVVTGFFERACREMSGWYAPPERRFNYEHTAIAEALAERDGSRAHALLRGHLRHALVRTERDDARSEVNPHS